jgi:glycosyltransferase involved in cell wall biosynthesis
MKGAPQVAIVARYSGKEALDRVKACAARQTYRAFSWIWVVPDHQRLAEKPTGLDQACCFENQLVSHLRKSDAEMIFFWPDQGDLKEAALEKMVLALQLGPSFDGLSDANRGGNGSLLLRNEPKFHALIHKWLTRDESWWTECRKQKMELRHLKENLAEGASLVAEKKDEERDAFLCALPSHFENYQPVPVDPVWRLAAETTDEQSILFLVSSLPMGGACKFTLDVVEQLKGKGFQVALATTAYYPNPWLDEFLRVVPDVFILPHLACAIDFPRLIVHLVRSRRCSRVVISHTMLGYQLLPYLRSELPDVAFLDYTHIEYESEWPHGGYAQLSANYQSLLDQSIVSSGHLRKWMTAKGADGDGIEVCHTNIDSDKWAPSPDARAQTRNDLGIDEQTGLILYPCRIAEQKRPDFMCLIIAALRMATLAPFVVVIAGDGPMMPLLQQFIEKYDLAAYFRLLGAVSLPRMAALHNAADIFLLPSKIEGISLALFEAMALESVPVVSDVGGQRELVTPDCGYLIPLENSKEELASYVRTLKQLLDNPQQRRQNAIACRERIKEHFRLDQMTDVFMQAMVKATQRHLLRKPPLPDASVCRDLATMAIDHTRLSYQGQGIQGRYFELQETFVKQQKLIAKLQKQLAASRPVTQTV